MLISTSLVCSLKHLSAFLILVSFQLCYTCLKLLQISEYLVSAVYALDLDLQLTRSALELVYLD